MTDELKDALAEISDAVAILRRMQSTDDSTIQVDYKTLKAVESFLVSSQRGAPRPYTMEEIETLRSIARSDNFAGYEIDGDFLDDLANRLSAGLSVPMLGDDTPFPIIQVLIILADAADHFLDAHACDHHGYELVSTARDYARKYAASSQSGETTK